MKFYGRKEEKKKFEAFLNRDDFQAAILYGRRRVGKTALIQECLKGRKEKILFFTSGQTAASFNLNAFSKVLSNTFPELGKARFDDFESALDYVFQKAKEEKVILVLDEYCYLRGTMPEIDDILLRLIDRNQDAHLKLILCGSVVSVMKEVLLEENPLHGRFRLKMEVLPFDYFSSAAFFHSLSAEDKFSYYSLFGGIPLYLSYVDPNKSFSENIQELLIERNSVLEAEIKTTISMEYAKFENASVLLSLLASGKKKYYDLKETYYAMTRHRGGFEYLLKQLMEAGFIRKIFPINKKEDNKKSFYQFNDNLLQFYSLYLFNEQSRNYLPAEVVYEKKIKEALEKEYLPKKFEDVSREFLIRMNKKGRVRELFLDIGTYYFDNPKRHRNGPFDVVTLDDKGYVFYECKYTKDKIGLSVVREEEERVRSLGLCGTRLGFLARNGFDNEMKEKDYVLYELKDYYDESLED